MALVFQFHAQVDNAGVSAAIAFQDIGGSSDVHDPFTPYRDSLRDGEWRIGRNSFAVVEGTVSVGR
jgi:hypothetical protein